MKTRQHRRAKRLSFPLAVFALAVTAATQAHGELPHYTLLDLPTSLDRFAPISVASSGDFLAGMRDSSDHVRAAIVHDGIASVLPQVAGADFTSALDMNDHGTVLAVDYKYVFVPDAPGSKTGFNDLGSPHAYLYANGQQTLLPMSVDGKLAGYSTLNNQGDLLGTLRSADGGNPQAFIYHSGTGQTEVLSGLNGATGALIGTDALHLDNAGRIYGVQTTADGHNSIVVYANDHVSTVPGTSFSGSVSLLSVNDAGQMLYWAGQGNRFGLFFYDKGQSTELGSNEINLTNGYELIQQGMTLPKALLPDGSVIGIGDGHHILFKNGESGDLDSLVHTADGHAPAIYEIAGEDGQGRILMRDSADTLHWLVPTTAVPELSQFNMMLAGLVTLGAWMRRRTKKAPEGALA